jgi:hypothetical protein
MKWKEEYLLAVGMFSLVLAFVLVRYLELSYLDFSVSSFLGGVFTGLSMVLNLSYLIKMRSRLSDTRVRREEGDSS